MLRKQPTLNQRFITIIKRFSELVVERWKGHLRRALDITSKATQSFSEKKCNYPACLTTEHEHPTIHYNYEN
jgi:hypothetical protein